MSVTNGEEILKAYGFDAENQMSSSMGITDGVIKRATYQYNGLGHSVSQSLWEGKGVQLERPKQQNRYSLDLTRQYHNLLQKTGNGASQTYFWDGNVTGMEEEKKISTGEQND